MRKAAKPAGSARANALPPIGQARPLAAAGDSVPQVPFGKNKPAQDLSQEQVAAVGKMTVFRHLRERYFGDTSTEVTMDDVIGLLRVSGDKTLVVRPTSVAPVEVAIHWFGEAPVTAVVCNGDGCVCHHAELGSTINIYWPVVDLVAKVPALWRIPVSFFSGGLLDQLCALMDEPDFHDRKIFIRGRRNNYILTSEPLSSRDHETDPLVLEFEARWGGKPLPLEGVITRLPNLEMVKRFPELRAQLEALDPEYLTQLETATVSK